MHLNQQSNNARTRRFASIAALLLVSGAAVAFVTTSSRAQKMEVLSFESTTQQFALSREENGTDCRDEFASRRVDIDGDGKEEDLVLEKERLTISSATVTRWQTPESWRVVDYAVAHVTGAASLELVVNVWKRGSFGLSKPFWITTDTTLLSNHLFVFRVRDGRVVPVWQSSALDRPNCVTMFAPLQKAGQDMLVTLEGTGDDPANCVADTVTVWQWNGWGFENAWRSEKGKYQRMCVSSKNSYEVLVDEK